MKNGNVIGQDSIEENDSELIYSNEFDKMVDGLALARNEVRKKIMGIF